MNWKQSYLAALLEGRMEGQARKLAGVTRQQVEAERLRDPLFAEEEKAVYELVTDSLEEEAIRRGRDGVIEEVWYKGEVVGQKVVKSDAVLLALLKGRRRNVYGDKSEVTGASALQICIRDVAAEAKITTAEQAREFLGIAPNEEVSSNPSSSAEAVPSLLPETKQQLDKIAEVEKKIAAFMEANAGLEYNNSLLAAAGQKVCSEEIGKAFTTGEANVTSATVKSTASQLSSMQAELLRLKQDAERRQQAQEQFESNGVQFKINPQVGTYMRSGQ